LSGLRGRRVAGGQCWRKPVSRSLARDPPRTVPVSSDTPTHPTNPIHPIHDTFRYISVDVSPPSYNHSPLGHAAPPKPPAPAAGFFPCSGGSPQTPFRQTAVRVEYANCPSPVHRSTTSFVYETQRNRAKRTRLRASPPGPRLSSAL
jgi:hypothetical protein